jgi:FAD synthase
MGSVLLPFSLVGRVVHGAGRGSATLGFPTANLEPGCYGHLFAQEADAETCAADDGVYYGWARVMGYDAAPQPMVMSVGRNPHFAGATRPVRTLEAHILRDYGAGTTFYGALMCIYAVGYLRPMRVFDTTEALIAAIADDIQTARQRLSEREAREGLGDVEDEWSRQLFAPALRR